MPTRAFVLMETAVGKSRAIVEALRRIPGVKSIDMVTGVYDIIVVLEADSMDTIGDIVSGKIHAIEGISRTVTCLALYSPEPVRPDSTSGGKRQVA